MVVHSGDLPGRSDSRANIRQNTSRRSANRGAKETGSTFKQTLASCYHIDAVIHHRLDLGHAPSGNPTKLPLCRPFRKSQQRKHDRRDCEEREKLFTFHIEPLIRYGKNAVKQLFKVRYIVLRILENQQPGYETRMTRNPLISLRSADLAQLRIADRQFSPKLDRVLPHRTLEVPKEGPAGSAFRSPSESQLFDKGERLCPEYSFADPDS